MESLFENCSQWQCFVSREDVYQDIAVRIWRKPCGGGRIVRRTGEKNGAKSETSGTKAREDIRHLRSKLESLVKECTSIKREKQDLAGENEELKSQLRLYQAEKGDLPICIGNSPTESEKTAVTSFPDNCAATPDKQEKEETLTAVKVLDLHITDETGDAEKDSSTCVANSLETDSKEQPPKLSSTEKVSPSPESSLAEDKLVLLEMKLAESQKSTLAERDEKYQLMKSLEKLREDMNSVKTKYEDMKRTKHEALVDLNKIRSDHKEEVSRVVMELEEETMNRTAMDRRLGEVRRELERLQRENADEWGKRERLETERLALERENKKLKNQIKDLEDQLDQKIQQASTVTDKDMKTLQTELSEKNKELNELRHTLARLKKAMQETTSELDHTKRRVEQYELEVKKLRVRVEEMRKDLATAEDEADNQGNTVRRLERTNDELQEQVENLQVQVEHLESRLKRSSTSSQSVLMSRAAVMKPYSHDISDCHDSDADIDEDDS
ncbi:hypothetical protein ScPMuIL_001171 [Solemya velum]